MRCAPLLGSVSPSLTQQRRHAYPRLPAGLCNAQTEIVLKGVVRAERLPDPTEFVAPILDRVKKEYIVRTYGIKDWEVSCGCQAAPPLTPLLFTHTYVT